MRQKNKVVRFCFGFENWNNYIDLQEIKKRNIVPNNRKSQYASEKLIFITNLGKEEVY